MAIAGAVTGEGAPGMQSGTELPPSSSAQCELTPRLPAGIPHHPFHPTHGLLKIPFQAQFFTSGFRANKYTFSVRLEERLSFLWNLSQRGANPQNFREAVRWPFQHFLLRHEWTVQGRASSQGSCWFQIKL